ncbi:magnesium/cobalt transporter CorA [Candidatus Woesearchaeota archaeon]|nr:magnesium/cobalt transporter CorA [Candidatus Woesearchaeota archaeon]
MLEVISFDKVLKKTSKLDTKKFSKFWISLTNPTKEELREIKQEFNIHKTTINNFSTKKRPKIEKFDNYNSIIIYDVKLEDNKLKTEPVHIILSKNFLITITQEPIKVIENLKKDKETLEEVINKNPEFLLHAIAEEILNNYFLTLEENDRELNLIESKVLKNVEPSILEKLFMIKRELIKIRRITYPQREIISNLLSNSNIDKEVSAYLRDLHENIILAIDLIDDQRERINSILEVHLSVTSNKLNEVMKVLTVIATILMPATLIASIYGMNFKFMPELGWKYGYLFALSLIIIVIILALVILKRKKWI